MCAGTQAGLAGRQGRPGDKEVGVDTSVARKGKILNASTPLVSRSSPSPTRLLRQRVREAGPGPDRRGWRCWAGRLLLHSMRALLLTPQLRGAGCAPAPGLHPSPRTSVGQGPPKKLSWARGTGLCFSKFYPICPQRCGSFLLHLSLPAPPLCLCPCPLGPLPALAMSPNGVPASIFLLYPSITGPATSKLFLILPLDRLLFVDGVTPKLLGEVPTALQD